VAQVEALAVTVAAPPAQPGRRGAQDTVGIDVALLDDTQRRLLALFPVPAAPPRPSGAAPSGAAAVATLCANAVTAALCKAANGLLDDLHRNVRLLGTPERCAARRPALRLIVLHGRATVGCPGRPAPQRPPARHAQAGALPGARALRRAALQSRAMFGHPG